MRCAHGCGNSSRLLVLHRSRGGTIPYVTYSRSTPDITTSGWSSARRNETLSRDALSEHLTVHDRAVDVVMLEDKRVLRRIDATRHEPALCAQEAVIPQVLAA